LPSSLPPSFVAALVLNILLFFHCVARSWTPRMLSAMKPPRTGRVDTQDQGSFGQSGSDDGRMNVHGDDYSDDTLEAVISYPQTSRGRRLMAILER